MIVSEKKEFKKYSGEVTKLEFFKSGYNQASSKNTKNNDVTNNGTISVTHKNVQIKTMIKVF